MINGQHETKAQYQERINQLKEARVQANLEYSNAREGSAERLRALRKLIEALQHEYTARTTGWQEEPWANDWRREGEQGSSHQHWIDRLNEQLIARRQEEANLSRVLEAQGQKHWWHDELK